MENIQQAIERARAYRSLSKAQVLDNLAKPLRHIESGGALKNMAEAPIGEIELNSTHLLSRRVVAYDGADRRSRPYDMLRTQILQSMSVNGWKIIGVTSPTPGCGKTLTAINLAFSMARQPEQSVALVDMDLQKAQIGPCLGLPPAVEGVSHLLEGRNALRNLTIPVRAGSQRIVVLPTGTTRESSALLASRAMRDLSRDLRGDFGTIIFDLPPTLSCDDVLAVLPWIDCVVLVAAIAHSKVSEVEECMRHLQSTQVIRVVLNKVTDTNANYYY